MKWEFPLGTHVKHINPEYNLCGSIVEIVSKTRNEYAEEFEPMYGVKILTAGPNTVIGRAERIRTVFETSLMPINPTNYGKEDD